MAVTAWLKDMARSVIFSPAMTKLCEDRPVVRRLYRGWRRTHPFDRENGTDTSGFVSVRSLHVAPALQTKINFYGPSQPSIFRKAIAALGPVDEYAFIDLGCGKGRCLLVATEFPFREVIGIELSTGLAEIARKNIARMKGKYPGRTAARVVEGNVLDFPFPEGKLIFYNYHAFRAEIIKSLVTRLENSAAENTPHLFFVYYNAVHSACLDASSQFQRFFADTISCGPAEKDCGFPEDVIVIWQSRRGAIPTPHQRVDRRVLSDGDMVCHLES
jgi:SAM-dependent methyltransferase